MHTSLTREPETVNPNNPIYFNKRRYTSWASLRDVKIPNYRGAKDHLKAEVIESWVRAGIVERVPRDELDSCVINPLQVAVGSSIESGRLAVKYRPVLHCKIKLVLSFLVLLSLAAHCLPLFVEEYSGMVFVL